MGHEALRCIVAYGQFENGRHKDGDLQYNGFHAVVFDPGFERRAGFMKSQYPKIFEYYDIQFMAHDGRSNEFFKFIEENAQKLKYIVVCLEDMETARDIAIRIIDRLHALGYSKKVYTCGINGIRCYSWNVQECSAHSIYDSTVLYSEEADKYAMELNHRRVGGMNAKDDWKQCGYLQRISRRASVDYLLPLIRRISNGALTPEQRENLARSEYLRWCAVHYALGHNMRLAEWDELDERPQNEAPMPYEKRNYKAYARGNVDAVMELMLDEEKEKGEIKNV